MNAYRVGAIVWVVIGLGINAAVHISLAAQLEALGSESGITVGTLFYVEAAANIVAGVLVLVARRRWTGVLSALVAAAGLVLLVWSTIAPLNLPLGLPEVPVAGWSWQKLVSAASQGIALVSGLAITATARRRR